jgi:hypothetical protein
MVYLATETWNVRGQVTGSKASLLPILVTSYVQVGDL